MLHSQHITLACALLQ